MIGQNLLYTKNYNSIQAKQRKFKDRVNANGHLDNNQVNIQLIEEAHRLEPDEILSQQRNFQDQSLC